MMANETQPVNQSASSTLSIGGRLKASREAQGLTRKDVAAQLRLNENVIAMMEDNQYPTSLPTTFIRGYLRSYGKLIGIPEAEMLAALEPIKPVVQPIEQEPLSTKTAPLTSSNYFMQISTYLIIFTVVGLAGTWWYNHSVSNAPATLAESLQAANEQSKSLPLPSIPSSTPENTLGPVAQNAEPQMPAPALLNSSDNHKQNIIAAAAPSTPSPVTEAEPASVPAEPASPAPKHIHAAARHIQPDDEADDEEDDRA